MKILITGGCGFIGSSLAKALSTQHEIIVLDNFYRKGSQFHKQSLKKLGIEIIEGDIRNPKDFPHTKVDTVIACASEPAVLTGHQADSPAFLLETNLNGTVNTLEHCRKNQAHLLFLSTSRVYSIPKLNKIKIKETGTRFVYLPPQKQKGVNKNGINSRFPTQPGIKSFYGASKLCAEIIAQEYSHTYNIPLTINRLGVVTGPGQLARPDQGIFAFWLWKHLLNQPLSYIGYGGTGLQTRDLLDIDDLNNLLEEQISDPEKWNQWLSNVGGGLENSLSLQETTTLAREITGNAPEIKKDPETRPMDIPWYITDNSRLTSKTNWEPKTSKEETLRKTGEWLQENQKELQKFL